MKLKLSYSLLAKTFLIFCTIYFSNLPAKAQNPIGVFDNQLDIGHPKIKGHTEYNPENQSYTLKGAGYNIWFNRDEFQYAYKKIKGDFLLTANFEFLNPDVEGSNHRKIGWMIRESLEDNSAEINACAHIDGLTVLQWRELKGAYMRDPEDEIFAPKKGGEIIQLERSGKTLIMRIAHRGEPLQLVGIHEMKDLKDEVLAGIYICSHDSNQVAEAKVWNLRIDKPLADIPFNASPSAKPNPEPGILACRLETMDMESGIRKVIHESKGRFEAPNWMPGGKKLLFNEGGELYTISTEGEEVQKLNTGKVNHLNNDHVLSKDGNWLGISSHRSGLNGGGSTVYVLPLQGGEPRLITEQTPSYLHGWNPNGKELAIVAQRNGFKIYNLYRVSIKDGKEIPLTENKIGHVDGPEYSPDGKYIYYNANASGTMQIWRMDRDGSHPIQLTFDELNNWFPHISPDGKKMVFISFPPSIDPNSHPSYKRVTLRWMPINGGSPQVIAYLYGGQGTMNVNSWSPDSKKIAFVSNSGQPLE